MCPYCGVGCQLTYHVKDNDIVRVEGRDGPANHERLCVKGRFGFDYVHHPQRLTKPLIRKPGMPKSADFVMDPADPLVGVPRGDAGKKRSRSPAERCATIRDTHGRNALAGFGSAKGSNEEAYLFQKLVRTGFGTNNVDHCTRLCHASSVAALLEGIGSGAVSNPVMDVMQADVVLLIGANPVVNHPVAATWIKNAVKHGTKLILADPRRSELARHATHYLQFKPDTDVALLNAMMHTIVEEGLVAESVHRRSHQRLRRNCARTSPTTAPRRWRRFAAFPAATIREVARLFATSRGSMILWGMGISQHIHGTDNARCLIALSMMTGQVGRPGTGLHPLRGQNNVQGASDVGLIPMMYPDYQRVDNGERARRVRSAVGHDARSRSPGSPSSRSWTRCTRARSAACTSWARIRRCRIPTCAMRAQALAELEMLVVQDIFLTETALSRRRDPAGLRVSRKDRHVHQHRPHRAARPAGARAAGRRAPGPARSSSRWRSASASTGTYAHPRDVFAEMRRAMPSIAGITWERLEREQRGHLSVRARRRSGRARRVHRGLSDADRHARASSRRRSFPPPSGPTPTIRSC